MKNVMIDDDEKVNKKTKIKICTSDLPGTMKRCQAMPGVGSQEPRVADQDFRPNTEIELYQWGGRTVRFYSCYKN
jgi:hypothetical protein